MGDSASRTAAVIGLCLVLGLVIIFLILDKTHGLQRDPLLGEKVLNTDIAASSTRIRMTKGSESVSLLRMQGDEWLVEEVEFPADSRKVFALLQTLTTAKYVRVMGTAEEQDRYGLAKDDQLHIELQGKGASFHVSLGAHRSGGGQYCKLLDHDRIYLINKAVDRSATLSSWRLYHLTDIPAAKVLKVAFETPDGQRFAFQRGKLNRFEPIDSTPQDLDENTAMAQMPGLLRELKFEQPIAKHEAPFQEIVTDLYLIKIELTSGTVLRLRIGKQTNNDDRWLLEAAAESLDVDDQHELRNFIKLADEWYFEVNEVIAKRFVKSRKDFLNTVRRQVENTPED